MMKTNCELKLTNMKTNSTQPRKEIFNDSFFTRKSIISEVNSEQLIVNNEQASFAFSYTQSRNMKTTSTEVTNSEQPLTVNHHTKPSFMKKFLRTAFPLAIAFVIANLFLTNVASSQAVTKTWNQTAGGNWATATNWTPNGVPTATDVVLIPVNQTAVITRSGTTNGETISIAGLVISGNVNFTFDPGTSGSVCTLNI